MLRFIKRHTSIRHPACFFRLSMCSPPLPMKAPRYWIGTSTRTFTKSTNHIYFYISYIKYINSKICIYKMLLIIHLLAFNWSRLFILTIQLNCPFSFLEPPMHSILQPLFYLHRKSNAYFQLFMHEITWFFFAFLTSCLEIVTTKLIPWNSRMTQFNISLFYRYK